MIERTFAAMGAKQFMKFSVVTIYPIIMTYSRLLVLLQKKLKESTIFSIMLILLRD